MIGTMIIIAAAVAAIAGFFLYVGHVPDVTRYPHEKSAEVSPYQGPCDNVGVEHDLQMNCSDLNMLLQPASTGG